MKTCNAGDITIGLYLMEGVWEVYYRKPGWYFRFAFGLPVDQTPTEQEAFRIARANVHYYDDLFTEDGVDYE